MEKSEFIQDLSPMDQSEINEAIESAITWLELNEHETAEIYAQKQTDLQDLVQTLRGKREKEELWKTNLLLHWRAQRSIASNLSVHLNLQIKNMQIYTITQTTFRIDFVLQL